MDVERATRHSAWRLTLAALVIGAGVGTASQPAYRTGIELVTVPITVQNKDPRVPLGALAAEDFRVREDGRDQRVVLFEPDARPLSVVVMLDVSSSMRGARQQLAADTARMLHAALGDDDEISLVPFADWPLVAIPWSRAGALPTLDWAQWVLPWDTALLDAVVAALQLADTSAHPRRIVVVISDGFENASALSLPDLVKTRRQSEVEVYGMRINPIEGPPGQVRHPLLSPRPQDAARDYLPDVVDSSGGLVYNVPSPDFMTAAVLSLMSNLRSQYLIGYESTRPLDGRYRRIRVDARSRALTVRHRSGYLALPSQ